jgi:hypothetical protein
MGPATVPAAAAEPKPKQQKKLVYKSVNPADLSSRYAAPMAY